jgi:hypothetical protein
MSDRDFRLWMRRVRTGGTVRRGGALAAQPARGSNKLLQISRPCRHFDTAVVSQTPFGPSGSALAPNLITGRFTTVPSPAVETINWGLSVQYSTYYLTSRFTGGPPKQEPLNQLVPLVEFSFQSPIGQATGATVNPGFAYVAVTWQVAAEVVVPMNGAGGSGVGFRAQLMFFLDDLIPLVFGKPLLTDKPEVNQIAW